MYIVYNFFRMNAQQNHELHKHLDNFEELVSILSVHKAIIEDSVNLMNPETSNLVFVRCTITRK